ncbi:Nuclear elongation and deformation protein 1 [Alternaria arborescens]|uniref:Nuclear elongation and deformation protein 1 n=1 Tax=Alternaria arborescens TaxID=156630 RepID=A0A4Q4RC95_9PLEO|nr:Nuclear elongation and deformation protein 1 [Alternaria arborescens]RYO14555.1 Nuclear elongation and deformation protein 1 [Alternaria arborescens]RYO54182.1 Nuclear elongation and deformation protein 1 [Alternaria arborescens]
MNYVRSITGSVSKGWNSINPATLSGAIDTIVVEHEDGSLACSPFHVRFGKYQILRPSDKKVEFRVNGELQDYSMKLGEGGEAFFVFETTRSIPAEMQTSPIASPAASPEQKPVEMPSERAFDEPEPFDLDNAGVSRRRGRMSMSVPTSDSIHAEAEFGRPKSGDWSGFHMQRASTDETVPSVKDGFAKTFEGTEAHGTGPERGPLQISKEDATAWNRSTRSASPPPVSASEALARAIKLSKKLFTSNIPNKVTETGDLELDMTGYKSSEEDALRAEVIARRILSDELAGDYDIGALIGADENGNLWIYSSEEAKAAAMAKTSMNVLNEAALQSTDALSDPGYQSDSGRSDDTAQFPTRRDSDSALGSSAPHSPNSSTQKSKARPETKTYAKTLRLTSEQLRALDLKPGANTMSFTVNRSKCEAYMFYWKHDVPIVISDIDGTITKSDALGHVLNMIGRDWTHQGVAKLYTDIVNNGYNIFYLTSRSVGQADTTRAYLNGVVQDNYRLPKGPVIMSPDRTIAALRREIYLRKPEVFKMACLRDIMQLFDKPAHQTPFYAGFGNRFTDALSYRSVNIPSTRIFTINSNAEVSLDVLSLNSYKTGYASMREIVDHFFPPVGLLVPAGGEAYTDFNYWREKPLDIADFTDSESEGGEDDDDDETEAASIRSEDEMGSEVGEDLEASYMSRESLDEMGEGDDYGGMEDSIVESIEGGDYVDRQYEDEEAEDEYDEDGDERTQIEGITPSIEMGLDTTVERMRDLNVKERSPTPRAR